MNILITGAAGFVGRNLAAALENIRTGKDRTRPGLTVGKLYLYDADSPAGLLEEGCRDADFVFHLAGVNRPKDPCAFMAGNHGFAAAVLEKLKAYGNTCPVMLSSSIQAACTGRYDGPYGRSKRAGEDLFFAYGEQIGAKVLVYRFPNIFGKWCRPNYNSAVATFCHNMANDLPVTVSDPAAQLELLYIDDLVAGMLDALEGREVRCGYEGLTVVPGQRFCRVPVTHRVTLGQIAELLESFRDQPKTLMMPSIPAGSFAKKLYSTYLSYLPPEKVAFPLKMNTDDRGSFTELLKTAHCGQFSVNIAVPGAAKGRHWHHSKWELFIVVAGRGLIRMRRIGTEEVLEFPVSGRRIEAVHMLPGYTHEIINLSGTENLVTLMWASEPFDPGSPDTYSEEV